MIDYFLTKNSLRVAKMNNDLKEQDMNYCGDPMFDDILKDLLTLTSVAKEEKNLSNDEENQAHTDSSENSDHSESSIAKSWEFLLLYYF